MLAVTDTGVGMDKATQERVFEPFFTTKELGKGTGLGLATVYGIVKQSNGYIWVSSEPGVGTTFWLYFPVVTFEPANAMAESAEVNVLAHAPSGTLLIVEDEKELRSAISAYLESKGYKVFQSPGGKEALEICQHLQAPPDLLLTDVIMPGMSGPELVREVRKLFPEIRSILMSGYADHRVKMETLGPFDSFIGKPISLKELDNRIRIALKPAG